MELDPETQLVLAGRDAADALTGDSSARAALEDTLSSLDGGAGAVACPTGPATVSTVARLFGNDAHLICAPDCYGGTERFPALVADANLPAVSYADPSDPEALTDAVRPETDAVWVATPSLPRLRVVDLEAVAAFADAHDLLLIVDNTALSPLLQRPLDHGADLVVYPTLRSLSGHADATGGAVVAGTQQLANLLDAAARTTDAAAPSDSKNILRGLQTLSVRTQRRETNARSLAYFLREHSAVERVCYPGLRSHPDHEAARWQQEGYGGIVPFFVDPEQVDAAALLKETEVIAPDASLDGVSSRIDHPATMSHTSLGHEHREALSVTDMLFRLSVGIESTDDLTTDLEQALDTAQTSTADSEQRRQPMGIKA
jgi:cystathionine gamma-synthase